LYRRAPVPLYYQLKELIRDKIRSGEWAEGMRLPSERELCEQYGVSRMTVRQSITDLVHEGLLYREQGRGTFVRRARINQQLDRLTSFTEDMLNRGQTPNARVLSAGMCEADSMVAERLQLPPGQEVFRLYRLRTSDGEPLALELTHIYFPGCERLLEEDLEHNSLYVLLETKYGIALVEALQEVEAGLAGKEEANLLRISPGSPVLLTRRTTYTDHGHPVEYAVSTYRGDRYTFCTRLTREWR